MQRIGKTPVARDSFKRSQKSLVSLEGELQDSWWKTGLKTGPVAVRRPLRCSGHGRGKPLPANRSGRRKVRDRLAQAYQKAALSAAAAADLGDMGLRKRSWGPGVNVLDIPRHPPNPSCSMNLVAESAIMRSQMGVKRSTRPVRLCPQESCWEGLAAIRLEPGG
jgi:hypothetical protein